MKRAGVARLGGLSPNVDLTAYHRLDSGDQFFALVHHLFEFFSGKCGELR